MLLFLKHLKSSANSDEYGHHARASADSVASRMPHTTPTTIDESTLIIIKGRKLTVLLLLVSSGCQFHDPTSKYTPDCGHRASSVGHARASDVITMSQNHSAHVLH